MKRISKKIEKAFIEAVRRYDMLRPGDRVLAGYSGGADSTALLHLLLSFKEKLDIEVCAAHVNHMIRGAEADADEAHCRAFCEENGISFFSVRQNVPAISEKNGTCTEETARSVRYAFFRRLQSENGFSRIALAHNAGDSAETILYNLTRGCGADGICGIQPVRGDIIRPLLICKKSDIYGYCKENGLSYVTDRTNSDPDYARNFIRQRILPLLRELNPEAEYAILSAGLLLSRDRAALDSIAAAHSLAEGRNALVALPDAILSRVVLFAYRDTLRGASSPDGRRAVLSAAQTDQILSVLRSLNPHGTVSLPGKIRFVRDRDVLRLQRGAVSTSVLWRHELHFGANPSEDGNALILMFRNENADRTDEKVAEEIKLDKNIYKFFIHVRLNPVRIEGTVAVRSRMPGDTLQIGGKHRKIKKLMQESKLPREILSALPILYDDRGILWIPGFPPRDGTTSDCSAAPILHIYYFAQRL